MKLSFDNATELNVSIIERTGVEAIEKQRRSSMGGIDSDIPPPAAKQF
jgi:hypothetical protein